MVKYQQKVVCCFNIFITLMNRLTDLLVRISPFMMSTKFSYKRFESLTIMLKYRRDRGRRNIA